MISVVIPVFNTVEYLPQCVDSILGQSFTDFEILLVDDGSTDGSAELCRGYVERHPDKIRLYSNKGNGLSDARNTAIVEASGDYIIFLDSDDIYFGNALEHLMDIMLSHPECDIVVAQFTHNINCAQSKGKLSFVSATDAIISTLYQHPYYHPSPCAKLYRREVFNAGNMFVSGRRYEDLEACPRFYFKARTIACTTECLYFYRKNPTSFINTWSESRADALWAVDAIESFVAENCREALSAARARKFSAYFNIFNLAVKVDRADLADRCWQFIVASRREVLHDSKERLKNKLGALLSFFGRRFTGSLGRLL
ncbi:MAG: glycosyltransferase family 2 protein [Muribaculaceae bacterium]|nr:glycosyltransferase family 2 protein [Muribaculaceae bacterium]